MSENIPTIDPADAFFALGHAVRWQAVRMMANGEAVSASDVARSLGRDFDGVSKHLRVLREAGVAASKSAEHDGRLELFYIPESFRPQPGVVDYGFCRLTFPGGAELVPRR